jgi:hypothetical protein
MKRTVVKFFPVAGSDLDKTAKAKQRDSLTASVDAENADGTLDLIVSVPDGQNELVKSVSSAADASPRFEDVL